MYGARPRLGRRWYQMYLEFIAGMSHPGGIILGSDIQYWLNAKEAE
jgi:hypothetical protein